MIIHSPDFTPPRFLRSPHAQSILPALLRSRRAPPREHSSIPTKDGDTITIAVTPRLHPRLALLSHGLEGSMESSYIIGMTRALQRAGWDVLTWNMRGCGGVPNKLPTWYHSGKSDDLALVVNYALSLQYPQIALLGFSVGGNITLKYLGERGDTVDPSIQSAVAISVPMDLRGSAQALARRSNRVYMEYLLRPLRARIREKALTYPDLFSTNGLASIKTFREFDERYTAPFHGFSSVDEYWDTSSSANYLSAVRVKTLAISAQDDPFLSPSCFPIERARDLTSFTLEITPRGGHVGFLDSYSLKSTWAEKRTVRFLGEL